MSLYYDAVSILSSPSSSGGSFKSRIYSTRSKASPAQIYALITEASKWDILLKEVIDNAGIVRLEHKLTPLLALLLVHDHLLSKNGIAAPAAHPLRQAVERHKTRVRAEFVKARVRRGCASVEELKDAILREKKAAQSLDAQSQSTTVYPRWVRINNVCTTLERQLDSTFKSYRRVPSIAQLEDNQEGLYVDPHIPDLVAVAPGVDFSGCPAYKNGEIILQDKASCFPAYLLLGDGDIHGQSKWKGDLVDACAAPGNKTTHLASLLCKQRSKARSPVRIFAMDASPARSKTLQKMVSQAGAENTVTVLSGQDFLALDPAEKRFANVTGLLLDPSCSGSGIVGRDDIPRLALPTTAKPLKDQGSGKNKKRKRGNDEEQVERLPANEGNNSSNANEVDTPNTNSDPERLTKLSNLQSRIVEHALAFPDAIRVTYSTCSIHQIENEGVVSRVLNSEVARRQDWRLMRRDEQPAGLREWKYRGVGPDTTTGTAAATAEAPFKVNLSNSELDSCLRCWPGDEGLGGFFVAGFVRDRGCEEEGNSNGNVNRDRDDNDDEEEWGGFSD